MAYRKLAAAVAAAGTGTTNKLLSHSLASSTYLSSKILHHLNPNLSTSQIPPNPNPNPTIFNPNHFTPKSSSALNHINPNPFSILTPPKFDQTRLFSTITRSENDEKPAESAKQTSRFRPLSPHLAIYRPQSNSTSSISNRVTGSFLVAAVLSFHLVCVKMGPICFTFPEFYKLMFYSSKETLLLSEIAALALAYHAYQGVRHLMADFTGSVKKVTK